MIEPDTVFLDEAAHFREGNILTTLAKMRGEGDSGGVFSVAEINDGQAIEARHFRELLQFLFPLFEIWSVIRMLRVRRLNDIVG